jgi:hypothetical protein
MSSIARSCGPAPAARGQVHGSTTPGRSAGLDAGRAAVPAGVVFIDRLQAAAASAIRAQRTSVDGPDIVLRAAEP